MISNLTLPPQKRPTNSVISAAAASRSAEESGGRPSRLNSTAVVSGRVRVWLAWRQIQRRVRTVFPSAKMNSPAGGCSIFVGPESHELFNCRGGPQGDILRQDIDGMAADRQQVAQRDDVADVDQGIDGRQLLAAQHAAQQRFDRGPVVARLVAQLAEDLAPGSQTRFRGEGFHLQPFTGQRLLAAQQFDQFGGRMHRSLTS